MNLTSLVNEKVAELKSLKLKEQEEKEQKEKEQKDKWMHKASLLHICLTSAGVEEEEIKQPAYISFEAPFVEFLVCNVLGKLKLVEGERINGFHLYLNGCLEKYFSIPGFEADDFQKYLIEAIAKICVTRQLEDAEVKEF